MSIGVNVISKGSPSLILRVLLISFGITILPKSSTLLTIPVAVPDIFVGFQKPSSSVDRCHSLRSLDSATGGAPIARPAEHIECASTYRAHQRISKIPSGIYIAARRAIDHDLPHCFHTGVQPPNIGILFFDALGQPVIVL